MGAGDCPKVLLAIIVFPMNDSQCFVNCETDVENDDNDLEKPAIKEGAMNLPEPIVA